MTPKQKKIAIGIGISAISIGILIYIRKRNEAEAQALLEYIATQKSQVDLSKATEQGIKEVQDVNLRADRVVVKEGGKILTGSIKQPEMKGYLAKYVQELHTAMKGVGTDTKKVFEVLSKIRTKNTLKWVDLMYKGVYGESLFEAMKSENALNNVNYGVFSDKTKYDLTIPGLSEAKWHPALASYLDKLPTY